MDDDNDADFAVAEDGCGGEGCTVPSKAADMAVASEEHRATLKRALLTLVKMTHARGFSVTTVAGYDVSDTVGAQTGSMLTGDAGLQGILAEFDDPARCSTAEDKEIIVVGRVARDGAREGSACAAQKLPPGAEMAVVCIAKGNVDVVRDVLQALKSLLPHVATVVLVSKSRLTSYTRKVIGAMVSPTVDFFHITDLQACVVEHSLVPPHVALTDTQEAAVRSVYKNAHFNRLPVRDPVVKFYGFQPGQALLVTETWGRRAPQHAFFEVVP